MRWIALALLLGLMMPACVAIRTFTGRRVTGTCAGACDHYVSCKANATSTDRSRCLQDCPRVFSDRESLGAFESLSCDDAVSYVDGDAISRVDSPATATTARAF